MVNQWTEIGIPPESRLLALHFEPVSGQFLAQLETPGDSGVKALFARRFDDKAYRRLTPDEGRVSYESIIVRPESTKILANVFRVRPGHSSEWHSIREIDVATGEMTTVLASEKLEVEPPYSRAWVSNVRKVKKEFDKARQAVESAEASYSGEPGVYSVRGDKDDEILCTSPSGRRTHMKVTSSVCKVSPSSGKYRKITRLGSGKKDAGDAVALAWAAPSERCAASLGFVGGRYVNSRLRALSLAARRTVRARR
ncbi:MAG: hypothetical protein R3B51_13420 [Thermodesulfobacteriota bacterium]